jgi:predicted O-methyltransferase YrrM
MMAAVERTRQLRRELRHLLSLRHLPVSVAAFQWRAHRLARHINDEFSLASSTRPDKLKLILSLAHGRRSVAELGAAAGWTATSLLLADPFRTVVAFDPVGPSTRELYLALAPRGVRERLRLVEGPGADIPPDIDRIDFLYIDSSHERDATIAEFQAWQPHLAVDALTVFDDFDHPDYPGVREAVHALGLVGEERHGLFIVRGADRAGLRPSAQPSAPP